MIYTVRVDAPNPLFAKMLLEQFGGPNGELAAAMRCFTQGLPRRVRARRRGAARRPQPPSSSVLIPARPAACAKAWPRR